MWPGAMGDVEQSIQSADSQPPITPEPSKGQGQVEDSDFQKDNKKLSIIFLNVRENPFCGQKSGHSSHRQELPPEEDKG